MSLLILQLPARERLPAQDAAIAPPSAPGTGDYHWVQSNDGRSFSSEGYCAVPLLPRTATVVAVLAASDVAFHRVVCPKAPAARMRAALAGLLEEQLLDEPDSLHLALAPGAKGGESTWVAACHRGWLAAELEALERQGLVVDRVTPAFWPDETTAAQLHLQLPPRASLGETTTSAESSLFDEENGLVTFSHAEGCATWPMRGTAARALLPSPLPPDTRCSASAALAGAAEHWLGQPVRVQTHVERLLIAAQGGWNLRQFELAPRHRGVAMLRDVWRHFRSPDWRPVRWGLVGLVVAQLVGLNAWAWLQQHELKTQREAMQQILRSTHPQVRAVLDAPVQMRRENETLRTAAGRAGDGDLEPLLSAAASVWPENLPVQSLRYEGQQLTLSAAGLTAAQAEPMRQRLAPAGWALEASDGRITLRRAPTGGPK